MKNKIGYTLIELMVVIAIVGLITAVAIPYYNNYVLGVTISKDLKVIDGIISDAQLYYNRYGSWPTADDLGIWSGAGGTGYIASGIKPATFGFLAIGAAASCSNVAAIWGRYNPAVLGNGISAASLVCVFANVDGMLRQRCFYSYSFSGAPTDLNYNSIWVGLPASDLETNNIAPELELINTTTSQDTNNFAPYVDAIFSDVGC